MLAVKTPKDLRLAPDERIGIRFDSQRLYWFDAATGARLRS